MKSKITLFLSLFLRTTWKPFSKKTKLTILLSLVVIFLLVGKYYLKSEVQVKTKSEPNTLSNVEEESTSDTNQLDNVQTINNPCPPQKYFSPKEQTEAYNFGIKIQQAVREKDIESLLSMIDGELVRGPRKKDFAGKSFSEVFSDEWTKAILSTKPNCTWPRRNGPELGHGKIWYDVITNNWSIHTIKGLTIKATSKPDKPSWVIEKKLLMANCFEIMAASGDNYEEYHKHYGGDSKFEEFYQNIGKYFGTKVPLDPINASWGEKISLAVDLNKCTTPYAGNEKTISLNNNSEKRTIEIGEKRVVEKYCSLDGDCEAGYYYDDSYTILRNLPKEACGLLAPQLKSGCIDVRLVERPSAVRGGFPSGHIYGIYKEATKNKLYVVPLKNIGTVNDALNFADTLIY